VTFVLCMYIIIIHVNHYDDAPAAVEDYTPSMSPRELRNPMQI